MVEGIHDEAKDDLVTHGYVCNECLAVFLSMNEFESHTRKESHNKEGVTRLDVLSGVRISDSKVVMIFGLPNTSPAFLSNEDNESISRS